MATCVRPSLSVTVSSRLGALLAALALACAAAPALAAPGTTTRVSVGPGGVQANNYSDRSVISGNGRYVVFVSAATNLVAGDTNGRDDIFVRDLVAGTTVRVSVSSAGAQANGDSAMPAISSDGRYVAFESAATNLVTGDTNGKTDIFLRDLVAGTTVLVSSGLGGAPANGVSTDSAVSDDGRYVAFASLASNLVANDTNGTADVFRRDMQLGVTALVSVSTAGGAANGSSLGTAISADGSRVAFESSASNLIATDTNGVEDIFVRTMPNGPTDRVSITTLGGEANGLSEDPAISKDGTVVAFASYATNLVPNDTNGVEDVFARCTVCMTTERISVGSNGAERTTFSERPSVSSDGRYVTFDSGQVYVRDRSNHLTELMSMSSSGTPGDMGSETSSISSDGKYVAFVGFADNLVAGDTNNAADIFVHERQTTYNVVTGTLTFENIAVPLPSSVDMRIDWIGNQEDLVTVPVMFDGTYFVSLPAGPLTVHLQYTPWLGVTVNADTTSGSATGVDLDMPGGDANADNKVNLLDLSTVLANFGGGPDGDLNLDGLVNLLDLSIVLSDFNLVGAP